MTEYLKVPTQDPVNNVINRPLPEELLAMKRNRLRDERRSIRWVASAMLIVALSMILGPLFIAENDGLYQKPTLRKRSTNACPPTNPGSIAPDQQTASSEFTPPPTTQVVAQTTHTTSVSLCSSQTKNV